MSTNKGLGLYQSNPRELFDGEPSDLLVDGYGRLVVTAAGFSIDSTTLAQKSTQLDAYAVEVAINNKLPSSLGQKTAANSFPVVMPNDAYWTISGYDLATNSNYVTPTYLENDVYLEEPLAVNTTGLTVVSGENYYPSADGVLIGSYRNISFEYSLTAANDGYVQLWVEATHGSASWTQRNVVTLAASSMTIGTTVIATPIVSGQNATIKDILHFDNANVTRMRLVVKAIAGLTGTGTSGDIKISFRRNS